MKTEKRNMICIPEARALFPFLTLLLVILTCDVKNADGLNKVQIENEAKKGMKIDSL